MHYKRVIPCLDVDGGRVVKGSRVRRPARRRRSGRAGRRYDRAGADELVFLDITATSDKRETVVELARRTADEVFIPFTIGGGIRSVADAQAVLDAGADKVSVNSAALARPELIDELAAHVRRPVRGAGDRRQGAPRRRAGRRIVAGGRTPTGRDAVAWAREGAERGAGEILLTSMDRDGTNAGYDLELTAAVAGAVGVPVIASGGAGELDHLAAALEAGADAVLCASIFHYGQHTVPEVKAALARTGSDPARGSGRAGARLRRMWRGRPSRGRCRGRRRLEPDGDPAHGCRAKRGLYRPRRGRLRAAESAAWLGEPTSCMLARLKAAAVRRPLRRNRPLRTHRNTRRAGRGAHSSRDDSTSRTAWAGPDRCGRRRHP